MYTQILAKPMYICKALRKDFLLTGYATNKHGKLFPLVSPQKESKMPSRGGVHSFRSITSCSSITSSDDICGLSLQSGSRNRLLIKTEVNCFKIWFLIIHLWLKIGHASESNWTDLRSFVSNLEENKMPNLIFNGTAFGDAMAFQKWLTSLKTFLPGWLH